MEFNEKNKQDWKAIQEKIFPIGIPKQCEWVDINDITSILNIISSIDNSNHMFYPTGGGIDIKSSSKSVEKNCIEIFSGMTDVLKPKRLLFESFDEPIWNYFRLEALELEATDIYEENMCQIEELIEIEPGKYISKSYWEEGKYNDEKLPKTARVVTRILKGDFVIFAKSSHYNRHSNTYDARHNNMSSEVFRLYIEKVMKDGW